MNGAVFVTRTLMDQLSAVPPEQSRQPLPVTRASAAPVGAGRTGGWLVARIGRLLALLRRTGPMPDLAAPIAQLAVTSPHLMRDIGIDPETRRMISAEEGPLPPAAAPEAVRDARSAVRPTVRARETARPRLPRRVVKSVVARPARGWRLVPVSHKARPVRQGPATTGC
jgi:hypothetical protein